MFYGRKLLNSLVFFFFKKTDSNEIYVTYYKFSHLKVYNSEVFRISQSCGTIITV